MQSHLRRPIAIACLLSSVIAIRNGRSYHGNRAPGSEPRPALLKAFLHGKENTTAVFVVTTSRRDPYADPDALASNAFDGVQSCSAAGKLSKFFGEGDFLPDLEFEATYNAKAYPCKMRPQGNSAERICEYHMTFDVACPLGTAVDDKASVELVRKDGGKKSYGYKSLERLPPPASNTKVAACAIVNLGKDENQNSATQLEDWISWHRMVGVDSFVLYGVAPRKMPGREAVPTFPQKSASESENVTSLLQRLLSEGDVSYEQLPAKPRMATGVAFNVMQQQQISDCLWRHRESSKPDASTSLVQQGGGSQIFVKLGDLDEFLHPLNDQMDVKVVHDALSKSELPFLPLRGVRWRRSDKEVAKGGIAPGRVSEFDAHEPHPTRVYPKSIVRPSRVALGRVHTDHEIFDEFKDISTGSKDPLVVLPNVFAKGAELAVMNHHFGGGGPHKETEVKDKSLLASFQPCLDLARVKPFDAQKVGSCRAGAQAKFLATFRERLNTVEEG